MKFLLTIVLVLACAACATADPNAEAREMPVYRTGSNLPSRDTVGRIENQKIDPTGIQMPNGVPPSTIRGGG